MALCPANCGSFELLQNPAAACDLNIREDAISRLLLWPCDVELPDPIQGAIAPLFADGTIVATSELSNFTINDPEFEDITISACRPAMRRIVSRSIQFQDRIAITVPEGSPAVDNPYWDWDAWKNKLQYSNRLNTGWVMCSGDVIIPVDKNGEPLSFTMNGFINWEQGGTVGSSWVEFKQIELLYRGDPFSFNKPVFNINTEGIIL